METAAWGMQFNQHPEYKRQPKSNQVSGYPEWFGQLQFNTLTAEGLIVWNNVDKTIEALNGQYTLDLLEKLETQDSWKTDGISVTRLVSEISLETPPRGRRKKSEPEPAKEPAKPKTYYKEMVHLPPEAGPQLIELLNENKSRIVSMAEMEKKLCADAMRRLFESILDFQRKHEVEQLDLSNRQFQWVSNKPNRWVCQNLSAEGHVCLDETKLFWCACVERQKRIEKSGHVKEFSSAIEWAETELINLPAQPEPTAPALFSFDAQSRKAMKVRLKDKLQSSPYWIDPSIIEPSRPSYKVLIEVDAAPVTFEIITTRCGDTIRLNERFPGQSKLAATISLDRDQFDFEQPLGDHSGWYLITSVTTFYQDNSVAEQSQKIWSQSRITQQFKEKHIRRARYGYEEVETGYKIYLGACENPDDSWRIPETRGEHMEGVAMRQSICYSLDVDDFRDFLGLPTKYASDEDLLETMHETRARSRYIAEETKRESKMWLAQHAKLS